MSIAEKITELNTIKTNLFTAISEKGVVIPEGSGLKDCPHMVENIPYINNGWENSYTTINGHIYPTIKKGGVEWLAQNLREVYTGIDLTTTYDGYSSGGNQAYRFKMAESDEDGSVENLLGYFYRQDTRDIIAANLTDGWRIPSIADFDTLFAMESDNRAFISPISQKYAGGTGYNTTGFSSIGCDKDGYSVMVHYMTTNNSGIYGTYMVTKTVRSDGVVDNANTGNSSIWYEIAVCRLVRNY